MKLILSMRCFLLLLVVHLVTVPPGSAGHHKKLRKLLLSNMGYYGYPVAEPCYSCVQPKPVVVYKPIPEPIPEPVCTSCVQPIRPRPCGNYCRPQPPPCCDGYGYASGYYSSRGYTNSAFGGGGGGGYYGPYAGAGGGGGGGFGGGLIEGGGGGGYGKRK